MSSVLALDWCPPICSFHSLGLLVLSRGLFPSSQVDNRALLKHQGSEVGNALTECQAIQWSHGNSADMSSVTLNPWGEKRCLLETRVPPTSTFFLGYRMGILCWNKVRVGSSLDHVNRGGAVSVRASGSSTECSHCWGFWHTQRIPSVLRLRSEDCASLGSIVIAQLRTKTKASKCKLLLPEGIILR